MARIKGNVIRRLINQGSKSEAEGVVLQCGDGTEWHLRIPGGNPFSDPQLDALVGKEVVVEGHADAQYLFIEKVEESGDDDR